MESPRRLNPESLQHRDSLYSQLHMRRWQEKNLCTFLPIWLWIYTSAPSFQPGCESRTALKSKALRNSISTRTKWQRGQPTNPFSPPSPHSFRPKVASWSLQQLLAGYLQFEHRRAKFHLVWSSFSQECLIESMFSIHICSTEEWLPGAHSVLIM